MMLQQLIQDSRARDDREAQREAREEQREAQREIREAQREIREEQREAQREIREQLRAGELHSILSTILSHVKPPPSIPLASPVLSSSTPHSSDSMTSGSSQRSPQQRSPAKEAKLRAAFLDAVLSGDNFNIGELIVPFFSTELSPSNELYAHRVVGRGIGDSKDFEISHDGTQTILLPPTDRKFGLSFFIPLSKNDIVLRHVHSYHGTTIGCLAYPLSKVPEGMKLKIDRIQVSSGEIGNNTPVMLHASLSTILNMNLSTFTEKVESWPDRLICSVAASGESDNESCCIENELVDVVNDQDGKSEWRDCDNATVTLLNEVVRKLSSSVP